jgi:sugar O-acyltransferase (sialic acid O-acetyltransferase NeuD family)
LCYLSPAADWEPLASDIQPGDSEAGRPRLEGLRITRPALALAEAHDLDLEHLPQGTLITEALIRNLIQEFQTPPPDRSSLAPLDPNSLVVYGAGGHGKSVIDLIRAGGIYRIHGVLDDQRRAGEELMGIQVLGGAAALDELFSGGVRQAANAVGGIGEIRVRVRVFERLAQAGFACPELIHPSAVVEESAAIEEGVQVFPQAYVGSECSLGFGVIVNTGAIVSHDCRLEDYANISPGAILAGGVTIGQGTLVGMGATVNLGVRVGAWARLGNGATVKADVPESGIVPAGTIWPR